MMHNARIILLAHREWALRKLRQDYETCFVVLIFFLFFFFGAFSTNQVKRFGIVYDDGERKEEKKIETNLRNQIK